MNTITDYFLSGCGWFIFSYLYISIGEHFIHKNFMHRKGLPEWVYKASNYAIEVFEAHGVRHHTQWYREFDYEPDENGRHENIGIPMKETIIMLVVAFPLWAPIFLVSTYGGWIFLATALLHNRLWSVLHSQMHLPENVFFKDWPLFRYIARNHFMHHQDMGGNFNVAFPFADYLFGTRTQPSQADIREMLRLGFIKPKSGLVQSLVDKWREAAQISRKQAV